MIVFFFIFVFLASVGRLNLTDLVILLTLNFSIFLFITPFLFLIKEKNGLLFVSVSLLVWIYLCFSSFSNLNEAAVIYGLNKLVVGLLIPLLLALILNFTIGVKDFYKFIFISTSIVIIVALIYKVPFGFFDRQVKFGLFGPITFGWFVGFWLFSASFIKITGKNLLYIHLAGLVLFVWSGSKGPLLAYILTSIIFNFKSIMRYFFTRLDFYILSGLLVLFLFLYGYDYSNNRIYLTTAAIFSGEVESDRLNMLVSGFEAAKKSIMFGVGFGGWLEFNFVHKYPHNIFIELLVEGGLIAIFYLFFVCFLIAKNNVYKLLVFYSLLVLTFSGDFSYMRYFIFFSTIILLSRRKQKL